VIHHENDLWVVTKMFHGTPGNKRAFYSVTMKSLTKGNTVTVKMSADQDVDVAYLDTRPMTYLYRDGDLFCFMDGETFEQIMLDKEFLEDTMLYIRENDEVKVRFFDGRPLSLELPATVDLQVTQTDPGVKGNTVNNHVKPAELETGLTVKVPLYIEEGEMVRVDTRSGEFQSRAKD
jgi:elongation factor P